MIITGMELTNFGSFGEKQVVDFTRFGDREHVLIIGENQDEPGMDSNGSAKTTLLNGISWGIFGKVPTGIAKGDVIRIGTEACEVKLAFLDGKDTLDIVRKRDIKDNHHLSWFINGDSQTKRTTGQTQRALLNYLGILENNTEYYQDFLNTTYFSVDAVKAFAGKESSSKERMDLIARFLNLEILDRCTSKVKVYANNTEGELDVIRGQLEFITNKLDEDFNQDKLESEIQELKADIKADQQENKSLRKKLEALRLVKNFQEQLEDFQSTIERTGADKTTIEDIYKDRIKDLKKNLTEIDPIKKELHKGEQQLDKSDKSTLILTIDQYQSSIDKNKSTIVEQRTRLKIIINQIEDYLSCPQCEAPLMFKENQLHELDVSILKQERETLEAQISKIEGQLSKDGQKQITEEKKLEQFENLEDKVSELKRSLSRLKDIPDKIKSAEAELIEKIASSEEYIRELEKKKLAVSLKLRKYPNLDPSIYEDIQLTLKTNEESITEAQDEISRFRIQIETYGRGLEDLKKKQKEESELVEQLINYQFWVKGFPEIRKWMIDSFLPSFEEQTNVFLSNLEVGMRIRFDTMKEKKKGGMKSQFDLSIIDINNKKRSLETYSAGEAKRIGVCVGFALRELTLNRGYNNFDFLLMDEVVDHLDETGISEFFRLLNNISGIKFIITHNTDLKNRFRHFIKVTKSNGISTITQT